MNASDKRVFNGMYSVGERKRKKNMRRLFNAFFYQDGFIEAVIDHVTEKDVCPFDKTRATCEYLPEFKFGNMQVRTSTCLACWEQWYKKTQRAKRQRDENKRGNHGKC